MKRTTESPFQLPAVTIPEFEQLEVCAHFASRKIRLSFGLRFFGRLLADRFWHLLLSLHSLLVCRSIPMSAFRPRAAFFSGMSFFSAEESRYRTDVNAA